MTSQDQAALVIWQGNPRDIAEMLLDRYFGRVTVQELEDQLQCVRSEMSCVITGLPSSLPPSVLSSSAA